MKLKFRYAAVLVTVSMSLPAAADIIYSNLQNLEIPTGWTGVTVTPVDGGSGQINPFLGGAGVLNNEYLQPARVSIAVDSAIVNLPIGTVMSYSNGALKFSSGANGSDEHLGTGTSQFHVGSEGYIGFKADNNYGWMRVVFTDDTAGAVIKDWAYDNSGSGGSIVIGRVQENVVVGDPTKHLVTLSPGTGEAFTLGSTLADKGGGVTNSVSKTGAGTTTIAIANSYSGGTIVNEGKLIVNNASGSGTGSGAVSVSSGATLGGTGIISGATTVNGTLAPGNGTGATGTLTLGATTFSGTSSIFEWDLNASKNDTRVGETYDKVDATAGAVTGTAIFTIVLGTNAFKDVFWSTNKTWTDIFSTGSGSKTLEEIFATFGGAGIASNGAVTAVPGYHGSFSFSNNTLNWTTGTFVPEPSTALAGLLLGAGLLRRRR